jgi:SAM-dependent methyltransferase
MSKRAANSMADFAVLLKEHIAAGTMQSLVLSNPREKTTAQSSPSQVNEALQKVTIRPMEIRGQQQFQFALRKGRQEFHENRTPDETIRQVLELFETVFLNAILRTSESEIDARINGKGRLRIQMKACRNDNQTTGGQQSATHNRTKNYLIPDGKPCAFLTEIGVMSQSGKVHAAKSRKFRQINRFLELVNDVLGGFSDRQSLNVIDFGCGKSSLTFALHHLLHDIHGRTIQLTGLDRDPHVIRKCSQIAKMLQCEGLSFHEGEIADFQLAESVDLVVSLHACDTATDDALAKAVRWNTEVILAVPCCQHELFARMQGDRLKSLTRHGILRERFAALTTDAMRAEILELCGYRTQVVEFIDMEHTAKNLLIRAVRRPGNHPASQDRIAAYQDMKANLGIETTPLELALADLLPDGLKSD